MKIGRRVNYTEVIENIANIAYGNKTYFGNIHLYLNKKEPDFKPT